MSDNENDKLQSVLRGALHDRRQPRIDVKSVVMIAAGVVLVTVFVMLVAGVTAVAVVTMLVK